MMSTNKLLEGSQFQRVLRLPFSSPRLLRSLRLSFVYIRVFVVYDLMASHCTLQYVGTASPIM